MPARPPLPADVPDAAVPLAPAARPGGIVRRGLPWLVAGGLVVLLVYRVGWEALQQAVRQADLRLLLGTTIACTLAMLALDALALSRVAAWFCRPVRYLAIGRVKAAAALANVVNYNAGSGLIALWLARHAQVSFLAAASAVLFLNVVDLLVLALLMAAGIPALDPTMRRGVGLVAALVGIAFAGLLAYWRAGIDFFLPRRIRRWSIFTSFRHATLGHFATLALIRLPFNLLFVLNNWAALRAFGLDVPFGYALAVVPVIAFVGIVPVTVAGLGTVQTATVVLLHPYGSEAQLLACSLATAAAMNGVRAVLALPFFGRVASELRASRADG